MISRDQIFKTAAVWSTIPIGQRASLARTFDVLEVMEMILEMVGAGNAEPV